VTVAVLLGLVMAQAGPVPEYARLVNDATQLLRQGKPDAAIRELNRAATLEPRSSAVHLGLGQAYLAKGSAQFVAEAKGEFQQARDLDPDQVLASFYVAKIDLDLGRVGAAERELQRALERKPNEHYLLALLGEVRRQQGNTDAAIELTSKALENDPASIPAYFFRALAWWDRKDEARALKDLRRVLTSPGATVEAYQLAGAIHLHFNRLAQAETNFREASRMAPARIEPHLRLAQVFRRQRRYDLALKEIAKVEVSHQLSSPYFQKLLADAEFEKGLILEAQGDSAGAKASFQRALEIDPSHAEARSQVRP
jgi:tetratricopeptide (TPR) repeat protein